MPEGRWEWTVFVLGLAVSAVLFGLIVLHDPEQRAQPAVSPTSTATPVRPPATTTTVTAPPTRVTTTAPQRAKDSQRPPVVVRLTARDDTWLSVRRSASAAPMFEGTLRAGESKTFSGSDFRVRFGGAANVEAVLNGKPLPLPSGTYSVTVGPGGLGPRSA